MRPKEWSLRFSRKCCNILIITALKNEEAFQNNTIALLKTKKACWSRPFQDFTLRKLLCF